MIILFYCLDHCVLSPSINQTLALARRESFTRQPGQLDFMSNELTPKRYYVYHLIDPTNDEVFYVGKGTGNRAYHHARDSRNLKGINPSKELRIRMIHNRGLEVRISKVCETDSEAEAFEIERMYIHRIGYHQLTNQAKSARSSAVNAYLHGKAFIDSMERRLSRGLIPCHKIAIAMQLIGEMQENLEFAMKVAGPRAIELALAKFVA